MADERQIRRVPNTQDQDQVKETESAAEYDTGSPVASDTSCREGRMAGGLLLLFVGLENHYQCHVEVHSRYMIR